MKNFLFVATLSLVVIAFALLVSFSLTKRYKIDLSVDSCKIGGCNGEVCQDASEETAASICIFDPKYECYKSATCERQANGKCGWTQTEETTKCFGRFTNPEDDSPEGKFCGGIAGVACPEGYNCKLDGSYPDAGGTCIKEPPTKLGEADSKEECDQKKGVWQKWGLLGSEYCQIPAVDAGKTCTDGSQCSLGKCISRGNNVPGECQTYKNTFGCFSFIEDGKIESAICID